ncbi:dehydrogenase [Oleiphilus messinensis]|uniref:Dehydrogenase n=1 Tax=Oleiphilus messinensis TaxID=141451 RepID=A0A1Y0I1A6_9GAMM|nr:molybdopterin-dependent oxidoreductase [Oleiphilus messinensis]ARU54181.1 dehydrogenase [Oleiphilus messinensis]
MENKDNIHFRTCNLCEAMCGLEIRHRDNRILSIRGDKKDPLSQGYICPKALALQDIHEDPDRLRQPMKKTDHGWVPITWNEAFKEIKTHLRPLQWRYGRDALGVYIGNPTVHNHGALLALLPLLGALGTRKRFSATSNDQLPHMLVNLKLFGHQALFPVPDIDHTDLFICLGANPMASNGSLMSAPDMRKRLKAIQNRGGEVIVIDPRKTETAKLADQHHFIRPGTDALLLLSMVNVLFHHQLVNLGRLQPYVDDVDLVELACQSFTPESVADSTGMSPEVIRDLALGLAKTPKAVLYSRMGTSTQEFGALSTWLVNVLNIITGHMDQRGGMMFTKPAVDLAEITALTGDKGHFDRYRSRVQKLPEFSDELPAATLAEEILTPGSGQMRALITFAGNPVLSSPNGKRLDKALSQLDYMISVDFYLNETSRHANLILPPVSPLERSHYDIGLNAVAVRNVSKYSAPLFKPSKQAKTDWDIMLELMRILSPRSVAGKFGSTAQYQLLKALGPDRVLNLLLQSGPYGLHPGKATRAIQALFDLFNDALPQRSQLKRAIRLSPFGEQNRTLVKGLSLDVLKNERHGIDLGPLQPCLPERIYHDNTKINIAPKIFLKDLSRLQQTFKKEQDKEPLILIGRRDVQSNNSWLHNSARLQKQNNRCELLIHPRDAEKHQLTSGDLIEIQSSTGRLKLPVCISDDLMPGVVCMPHGWGHNRSGVALKVAGQNPGASMNDLTDAECVDRLCGTSVFTGIEVNLNRI